MDEYDCCPQCDDTDTSVSNAILECPNGHIHCWNCRVEVSGLLRGIGHSLGVCTVEYGCPECEETDYEEVGYMPTDEDDEDDYGDDDDEEEFEDDDDNEDADEDADDEVEAADEVPSERQQRPVTFAGGVADGSVDPLLVVLLLCVFLDRSNRRARDDDEQDSVDDCDDTGDNLSDDIEGSIDNSDKEKNEADERSRNVQALRGASKEVLRQLRRAICPNCNGDGRLHLSRGDELCERCYGKGWVSFTPYFVLRLEKEMDEERKRADEDLDNFIKGLS